MKNILKISLSISILVSVCGLAYTSPVIKTFCKAQTNLSSCITNCKQKFNQDTNFRQAAITGCKKYLNNNPSLLNLLSTPTISGLTSCTQAEFACGGMGNSPSVNDGMGGLCRVEPSCKANCN